MKDDKPRAGLYARISTVNHRQDADVQLRELRDYCGRRGWQIAGEYVDRGISGTRERRPELDKLMKVAHQRQVDAVVVARFDRMARSVSHLLKVLETFNALGIAFISLSEQIDTTTPAGKMVFTVLGAVAELERNIIRERIMAGLRHAHAKGRRSGPKGPRIPLNLDAIRERMAAGESLRAVAKALKVSPSLLSKRLKAT